MRIRRILMAIGIAAPLAAGIAVPLATAAAPATPVAASATSNGFVYW